MTHARLVAFEAGYEQRSFWRNPAAAFFTFAFPVLLLVIFATMNNKVTITTLGPVHINYAQYFTPAIIAFGIMGACFTNLAIALCLRRESGLLKRVRGTPLPPWVFLAGLLANAIILSIVLTAIVTGVGIAGYNVTFPRHWVALLLTLSIGAASFCALGTAATVFMPNAEAGPAILNGIFYPLIFISGTFFPIGPASVLARIANVFPVRHFVNATFNAFDPRIHGTAIDAHDLLIVAAWGIAGAALALRKFRWEPRSR
jgi:ABC-2 type transport system permease protein